MKTHNGQFFLPQKPLDGWENAEWETLRQGAAMTLRERLLWLEQANTLAVQLQQAKKEPLLKRRKA